MGCCVCFLCLVGDLLSLASLGLGVVCWFCLIVGCLVVVRVGWHLFWFGFYGVAC